MRPEEVRLAYLAPLAAGPLLAFFATRAMPGVEAVEGRTFRRALRTNDGRATVVGLTSDPSERHVTLEATVGETAEPGGLDAIVQVARRLFDLDADPAEIDATLGADPALAPLVRMTPGIRLPGAADGFELAVRAVLGQQVSVQAARTLAGRIAARHGDRLERPVGAITHVFPTAARLAEASLAALGLTTSRAQTIRRLAGLVAEGSLDLSGTADLEETVAALGEVPGIGPWTCAYVAMRALRDPDAFPASDLGVRRGFAVLGLPATPAAIRERADRWRPWRAYAVMHLWNAEA